MIVTIDGPAGAGKSTVAKRLAQRLGFEFLDTGAMYRVITLAAMIKGIAWNEVERLAELARSCDFDLRDSRMTLEGSDVSEAIRSPEITQLVKHVADPPLVRQALVDRQRLWVSTRDVVTEGRDQGTVAFPKAECKIFLVASPEERARRRHRELTAKGMTLSEDEVLAMQLDRDERDSSRPVGALKRADDAVEFSTDGLSLDEVVDRLEAIVRERSASILSLDVESKKAE